MDIFDAVYLLMTGVGINIFWTFLFFQWDILPHSLTLLSYLFSIVPSIIFTLCTWTLDIYKHKFIAFLGTGICLLLISKIHGLVM